MDEYLTDFNNLDEAATGTLHHARFQTETSQNETCVSGNKTNNNNFTERSVYLWIVSVMLSDTWNNNLSVSVAKQAFYADATLTFAVAQRDYTAAIATIQTKFQSFKYPNM